MKTYRFCPLILINKSSFLPLINWLKTSQFKKPIIIDFNHQNNWFNKLRLRSGLITKGVLHRYININKIKDLNKLKNLSPSCIIGFGNKEQMDAIKYLFPKSTLGFIETSVDSLSSMSILGYYQNKSFVNEHNIPSFVMSKNTNKTIKKINQDILLSIYKNITIGCHAYYASGDLFLQTQASGVLKETYLLLKQFLKQPKLKSKQRKLWINDLLNVELMAFNVYNNIPITLCKIMNGFIKQAKGRDQLYEIMAKNWETEFTKFDSCCKDKRYILNKVIKNIDRRDMLKTFKDFYAIYAI
ncbi:MAG: hypothetical protein L3I91_02800 [Mycoplasma sp.]